MKSQSQQILPEEIELEQKRSELASLRARHDAACAALRQVRDEIADFEKAYDRTLGRRMAELDRLEAEIAGLTGYGSGEGYRHQGGGSTGTDSSSTGRQGAQRGQAKERAGQAGSDEIKSLYREVAKAIHPDLGGSGVAGVDRHELMARANTAYARRDRRVLQEILRTWQQSPEAVRGTDIAAELVRVIRQIAQVRKDIEDVQAKVADLRSSYLCRFKLKVDSHLARGSDLFAEMVAAADLNIARARKRLAALKGERVQESAFGQSGFSGQESYGRESYYSNASGASGAGRTSGPAPGTGERREICFPVEDFSGTLYLRDRSSLNFAQWKKLGPASGCFQVGTDKAVRLDVKGDAKVKMSQLKMIGANDLQALFLYGVGDGDLDSIFHLTGLEELYLSGPKLTDAALTGISKLSNLQRIYLYQTFISDRGLAHLQQLPRLKGLTSSGNSITDEGLAVFQKAIPGVKTVSFPWRFGR